VCGFFMVLFMIRCPVKQVAGDKLSRLITLIRASSKASVGSESDGWSVSTVMGAGALFPELLP